MRFSVNISRFACLVQSKRVYLLRKIKIDMKKVFYSLAVALVALVSCTPSGNGPVIVNPGDVLVGKNEVLDADNQKKKLEQVGNKALVLFNAREFDDLADLTEAFYDHAERYYSDMDYDWTELQEAGEDIWDSLYDERQRSEYKWKYTYTLFLSNCTGIVTFGKHEVNYQHSEQTKVVFEDVDGETWEATLVAKDLKKVFLGKWLDTYYSSYYDREYVEEYNVTVEIPKSLKFEVTKSGRFFASVTANFNYNISEDGVDLDDDSFKVSFEVKIDDLVAKLENLSVNGATGELSYGVTLLKDGMFVASQKVSSQVEYDVEVEDGKVVSSDVDGATLAVEANLLGEIQVKGTCADLSKLTEYLLKRYETRNQGQRAAERATDLVNLNLYYDGTSSVQARLEFEAVAYGDRNYGSEVYYVEPVIVFWDESRYLFSEYFEADDFSDLLLNLQDFLYDYENMVEGIY